MPLNEHNDLNSSAESPNHSKSDNNITKDWEILDTNLLTQISDLSKELKKDKIKTPKELVNAVLGVINKASEYIKLDKLPDQAKKIFNSIYEKLKQAYNKMSETNRAIASAAIDTALKIVIAIPKELGKFMPEKIRNYFSEAAEGAKSMQLKRQQEKEQTNTRQAI